MASRSVSIQVMSPRSYVPALLRLAGPVALARLRVLAPSVPLHVIYVAGAYFLEAIKRPTISTMAMWSANVVNLVLVLVLVPKHGAVGAAWATVGARAFLAASTVGWILLREGNRY